MKTLFHSWSSTFQFLHLEMADDSRSSLAFATRIVSLSRRNPTDKKPEQEGNEKFPNASITCCRHPLMFIDQVAIFQSKWIPGDGWRIVFCSPRGTRKAFRLLKCSFILSWMNHLAGKQIGISMSTYSYKKSSQPINCVRKTEMRERKRSCRNRQRVRCKEGPKYPEGLPIFCPGHHVTDLGWSGPSVETTSSPNYQRIRAKVSLISRGANTYKWCLITFFFMLRPINYRSYCWKESEPTNRSRQSTRIHVFKKIEGSVDTSNSTLVSCRDEPKPI